jgi:hypothetical protein
MAHLVDGFRAAVLGTSPDVVALTVITLLGVVSVLIGAFSRCSTGCSRMSSSDVLVSSTASKRYLLGQGRRAACSISVARRARPGRCEI